MIDLPEDVDFFGGEAHCELGPNGTNLRVRHNRVLAGV